MSEEFNVKKLLAFYKRSLTGSVLPFWLKYGMDSVHGGIYTGLDRDGSLLESDKSVWFQGRALWTFAQSYMTAASYGEEHPEYLDACRSLADFIEKHCTDKTDGRMYFRLTKDGKPVIKRLRYFFSETFAVVGFAAYGRASGQAAYVQKAFELLKKIDEIRSTPGLLIPKFDVKNAPARGFGVPMILLNTVSELRAALRQFNMEGEDFCIRYIDALLKEIKTYASFKATTGYKDSTHLLLLLEKHGALITKKDYTEGVCYSFEVLEENKTALLSLIKERIRAVTIE